MSIDDDMTCPRCGPLARLYENHICPRFGEPVSLIKNLDEIRNKIDVQWGHYGVIEIRKDADRMERSLRVLLKAMAEMLECDHPTDEQEEMDKALEEITTIMNER